MQCGGQESEVSECRFDSWGENDCDASEAAGVQCDWPPAVPDKLEKPAAAERPFAPTKRVLKHKIKVITYERTP